MTTIQQLRENYLLCVICSDEFTNPATLLCDHTFCRACILRYTKTQPEAIQVKSIPCPVCRRMTIVISPDTPVHEWPSQVEPSPSIKKLMIDLFGSGTQGGNTCSACHNGRETTPATAWCPDCEAAFCDSCLQHHHRMPLSRQHEVHSLPRGRNANNNGVLMCQQHKDEVMHNFCTDCKAVACALCLTMFHSHCKNVLLIKDTIQEEIKRSDSTKEVKLRRNERTESVSEDIDKVERRIRDTCEEGIATVVEKEKELVAEVDTIRRGQSKILEDQLDSDEDKVECLQQKMLMVDQALKSGHAKEMFDVYEQYEHYERYEPDEEDVETGNRMELEVPLFKVTLETFKKTMGDVKLWKTIGNEAKSFNMRHNEDKGDPYLTDVAVIRDNGIRRIVVTDSSNKSIKSVFMDGTQHFLSTLRLEEPPFGVANYDSKYVFVTVPSSKMILKVAVNPSLSKSAVISTEQRYYGIQVLDASRLIACADHDSRMSFFMIRRSSSVNILNMQGKVLKSIKQRLLSSPVYVQAFSSENILISDRKNKSLVSLCLKGKVIFTYKSTKQRTLEQPRGIAVCNNGDILLVDCGSNKVVRLNKSGEYVRDILTSFDGLDKPSGICVNDEELLYVTSGHFVKVFTF